LEGTSSSLDIRGDVVKVATFGDNGVLRIGGGSISADTTMQLYAEGSMGQVVFVADVSLNGNSTKSIAGFIVTILQDVEVNIGGSKATVYVGKDENGNYNANFSELNGGNGSTNGTFTGMGINPLQDFASRPSIGPHPGD
ncbi:MAG: hypothetical protein ABR589_12120, partial [Chthoniobacterales bacterium]